MTEEINHAFDGGLYAEMVRNRTMRATWDGVNQWTVVREGNALAEMSADKTTGPSEALPNSLKLKVERADRSNIAGVRNDGYWGMAVKPGTTYRGSFYAKTDDPAIGSVVAALVNDESGKVAGSAAVEGLTTGWKQHEYAIKVADAIPGASYHLQLAVSHPGTLWLTLVSLFPPTYHDRTNGFRIDLMEKLAAMHPHFLRFPGGNYLEGDHLDQRFQWKKTIGPLVDRPTHAQPWGYQSSDGMAGDHQTGTGSRAIRAGRDGRTGIRYRGHDDKMGSGAREVRASRAVRIEVRRDRQRGRVRQERQLRRALRAVLQSDQGEVSGLAAHRYDSTEEHETGRAGRSLLPERGRDDG
jgi:hypothetical protein